MKNPSPRDLQKSIVSALGKPPNFKLNICCEQEMEEFFKLQREGVCRYFLKNQCKKGDQCEFRHEQDKTKTMKYKTKLCNNYKERGMCKYKDQCSYAHGEKQLKGTPGGYS